MLIIEKKYKDGRIEEKRVDNFGEARKILNLTSHNYYKCMEELERKYKDADYTIYMVVKKSKCPIDKKKITHIF